MVSRRNGFTLIELLVVIAIIAILAAILFPVLMNAKRSAKENTCIYNQKQWGAAMTRYIDDNNGGFPWAGTDSAFPHKLLPPPRGQGGKYISWVGCLLPYVNNNRAMLYCPLWKGSQQAKYWPGIDTSYWYNCAHNNDNVARHPGSELCGHKFSEVAAPSKKPFLTEINAPHATDNEMEHGIVGQAQVYCDGHAKLTKGTWPEIYKIGYRNLSGIYH